MNGALGFSDKRIDDGFLEFMRYLGDEIRIVQFFCRLLFERVEDGSLQAGERKPVVVGIQQRAWKSFCWPAFSPGPIGIGTSPDLRSARVGEAEHFGDLVERLACSIIIGLAEELVLEMILHEDELSMTARDDQREERETEFGTGSEKIRINMPFEMIDAEERFLPGECERLGS